MNIKQLRKNMGLTQKDAAKRLGILPTALYKYEAGLVEPNISMLIKMADFYATSVDEVVGAKTPMLDLRKLDENQKELILEIVNLPKSKVDHVLGYVKALKDKF